MFDGTYWMQREGATIGTNAATLYLELFYGYCEINFLTPKYKAELALPLRFVNDGIMVWHNPAIGLHHDWKAAICW